jgi:MFS family permease
LAGLPPEAAVLSVIAFCVALGFGIAAPALPLYARTFGVSAFAAGAVISVFALMRLVASPGAGRAIERVGERRVLTAGLVIVAASSLLAALAGSYWQLLVFRGVGGIGSAMFTVSAMALLLRVVAPDQRGRAAGAFQAGFLVGGVTGPALGGAVVGLSIRAPFLLYAGTLAAAAVVAWRRLPAHVPAPPQDLDRPGPGADGTTLAAALADRSYRAALAANLTNGFVTFGLRMSLVPLFVVEGLREPASLSGIAFLVAAAANAAVLLPAGRMTDTRGRRPATLVGTSATAVGMVALAAAGAPLPFLLAMTVLGAAAAFLGSAPAATVGDIAGAGGRGSVIAAFQMTADFGAIVGPLAAGLLADALGYEAAFLTGAAVAAAAFLLAVLMRETLHRAP